MEPDEREIRAGKILDAFVPDLVSLKKYEGFLRRLFECEKGVWHKVKALCDVLPETAGVFDALDKVTDGDLVVVWLDHPGAPEFAYVHFFADEYFWKTSAICRRMSVALEGTPDSDMRTANKNRK